MDQRTWTNYADMVHLATIIAQLRGYVLVQAAVDDINLGRLEAQILYLLSIEPFTSSEVVAGRPYQSLGLAILDPAIAVFDPFYIMRGSSNTTKVPARPFSGFSGCTYGLIDFRYNGSLRPGVGLSDCFSKANLGMLSNGEEHVLQDREAIRLYLSWPGYSTANTYVTIRCGPTTRARLAYEVSNHVAAFLQKCASMPVSSSSAQWRVGAGGITPNNVILTTVIDMGNGIWQAELEVAF